MTENLYRDAFVGIRARLGELTARIQDREAEVTDAFWKSLPKAQRTRLEDLREGLELTTTNDFEELARAENMLASYLEELEGLLSMLPSLERDWTALPDDVPVRASKDYHPSLWQTPLANADTDELHRTFLEVVRMRDPHAMVENDGPVSQVARFVDHDAPFALRSTVLSVMGNGSLSPQVGEVGMALFTSIRHALPALSIRHENIVLTVGKVLGIKDDIEVGDPSFDGLFLIEGSQEASDLFLTPQVRTHLLTLARYDVPTLVVDPESRLASIQWRFEPAPKALEAAVKVLLAVRQTPPYFRFRSICGR